MLAGVICLVCAVLGYFCGRASLLKGLIAVFATGYFYGIVRANVLSPFSHFVFDAGLVGLYMSQLWGKSTLEQKARSSGLRPWLIALIAWPVLLCFLPFQTPVISMVGLRGNVFFLPLCLLAVRLKNEDWIRLAAALATLNLIALTFGVAEYFLGIERFYPISPVTSIIYASKDVGGMQFFRIPGIFSSAHAYAGTMVATLPLLMGMWAEAAIGRVQRWLLVGGIAAAGGGILMANARSHVVAAMIVAGAGLLQSRISLGKRILCLAMLCGAVLLAAGNERFQRATTLADTEAVEGRIHGSVNRTFLEILFEYPMGNGLGGGGTSIPSFLEGQVRKPIEMENEYARILLEQGIVGLLMWIGFIGRFLLLGFAGGAGEYSGTRRLLWICCAIFLGVGLIGTGMLTSIPQTALMMLGMGWVMAPSAKKVGRVSSPATADNLVYAR